MPLKRPRRDVWSHETPEVKKKKTPADIRLLESESEQASSNLAKPALHTEETHVGLLGTDSSPYLTKGHSRLESYSIIGATRRFPRIRQPFFAELETTRAKPTSYVKGNSTTPENTKRKDHKEKPNPTSSHKNSQKLPENLELDKTKSPRSIQAPSPPKTLKSLCLSERKWKALEESSQESLPRFLFRGFGPDSGGGIDPRLNTTAGIVPHGFLNGQKPTNIYEIPRLHAMVAGHLSGRTSIKSCFSSWAACLSVATVFARGRGNRSYVAIIDTALLSPHVKIYHVPKLREAGICHHHIPVEYLAYGPINGPAFHCVAYDDIFAGNFASLAGRSYRNTSFDWSIYGHLDKRVAAAKKLASLFCPNPKERPDIIIALTTAFSSLVHCGPVMMLAKMTLDKKLFGELIVHLAHEIKNAMVSTTGPKKPGLVNPLMYRELPQLKQMVLLLERIELLFLS